MFDIKNLEDEDLMEERKELVGSIRGGDGRTTKKISERIKQMTHQKGIERNG